MSVVAVILYAAVIVVGFAGCMVAVLWQPLEKKDRS